MTMLMLLIIAAAELRLLAGGRGRSAFISAEVYIIIYLLVADELLITVAVVATNF